MRVNVYAEEMTNRVEIVEKMVDGERFTGVRFYLELPVSQGLPGPDGVQSHVAGPFIHKPGDDDSAAVTFWGKKELHASLTKALQLLDEQRRYERRGEPADGGQEPSR